MSLLARRLRERYDTIQKQAEMAMEYLEAKPLFARAQVDVLDALAKVRQELRNAVPISPERLRLVLEILDIRAAGYLPLVDDIASQKQYMNLIAGFEIAALEEYTSLSPRTFVFRKDTPAEREINPSDYQIYNARNSGIHKPEFYKWLKGNLSPESQTAKNFERFLREKRAPIPRPSKA